MEQQTRQPELNALGKLAARVFTYGHNAVNNVQDGFSQMSLQSWIRLTMIVGGYMLLRPYLLKLSTKVAVKKMEEEDERSRRQDDTAPRLTPNELRGLKDKLSEVPEEGDGSGADWGTRARLRQRQMLKDLLDEEERRRAADNEDADIQEFLVD